MKKRYLILLLSLFSAATCFAGAELDVDEATYYFGTVPQNSKVYHYYWFRSIGSDTVIIDSVNTGCSCAILGASKLRIAPGDSVLVPMTWDVGRRMNLLGQSTKIYYNRRLVPKDIGLRALVRMKPEASLPFAIVPYRFEFGSVPSTKMSIDSVGFQIYNDYNYDITITVISRPMDGLEIVLPDLIGPKAKGEGFARLSPERGSQEFEYSVTFEISDDERSRFTVPVRRRFYK